MTFPWNCLKCPKSSLKDSPTLMLYKLVGSGMKEKLSMCRFMDSPWRKYRSKESPAGVVVEVLGIRILHLANLHCGRRRMTFMSGSGRSRNYSLCGKKGKTHWPLFDWVWNPRIDSFSFIPDPTSLYNMRVGELLREDFGHMRQILSPEKVTNVTSLTQIWDGNLGRNWAKTHLRPRMD